MRGPRPLLARRCCYRLVWFEGVVRLVSADACERLVVEATAADLHTQNPEIGRRPTAVEGFQSGSAV